MMTTRDLLYALSARAYFDRAVHLARARRWAEAKEDLDRYSALQPADYRSPLLRAKICLHEGQLQQCLISLEDARRLGHGKEDNERMVERIRKKDRRRHARLVVRQRTRDLLIAIVWAIGRGTNYLISNVWRGFSQLWKSLSFRFQKNEPDKGQPACNESVTATAVVSDAKVNSSTEAATGDTDGMTHDDADPTAAPTAPAADPISAESMAADETIQQIDTAPKGDVPQDGRTT
jgi:hypothetical protein